MPTSGRKHHIWISDPASADGDDCLGAYFTIDRAGQDPHGYGEHFDPGCGPEITIVAVQTENGRLVELTDDQYEVAEAEICTRFDFRAALREEREQDAELTMLEGVL